MTFTTRYSSIVGEYSERSQNLIHRIANLDNRVRGNFFMDFGSWMTIPRVTAEVIGFKLIRLRRNTLMLVLCITEPAAYVGEGITYSTIKGSAHTYNSVIERVANRQRGVDA